MASSSLSFGQLGSAISDVVDSIGSTFSGNKGKGLNFDVNNFISLLGGGSNPDRELPHPLMAPILGDFVAKSLGVKPLQLDFGQNSSKIDLINSAAKSATNLTTKKSKSAKENTVDQPLDQVSKAVAFLKQEAENFFQTPQFELLHKEMGRQVLNQLLTGGNKTSTMPSSLTAKSGAKNG